MSTKMYLTFLGLFAYFAINTANAALETKTVLENRNTTIATSIYAIEAK